LRIVLFGPPGSGKGTQASLLAKQTGAAHISTGDALREAVANRTDVGLKAKSYMDKGELVPDDVVIAIARDRLSRAGDAGFILDGFPRTVAQAQALDAALAEIVKPLNHVVNLRVDEDEIVKRLAGRRVCEGCGEPYHVDTKISSKGDACEKCGGKLVQRDDDKAEAIRNRLQVYKAQTEPVLGYYERTGLLRNVDAVGDIGDIANRILEAIGQ
jgi:adenylate kinase